MNAGLHVLWIAAALTIGGRGAAAGGLGDLLADYRVQGAGPFSAEQGSRMWEQSVPAPDGRGTRSCTTCHTTDLRRPGRHATTGKLIEPLAPSVSPKRLADAKTIEKWFLRNCKWTWGRTCTPQEKGDLLSFLQGQ